MTSPKKSRPEREQTDQSLRTERANSDRALAERQAIAEENADEVLQRARENADAVVLAARDKADEGLSAPRPSAAVALSDKRDAEDEAVRDERAEADDALQKEREENARALARLLPLERDKTDRYLLTERVRSDDDVSNRDDFLGIVSHDLRSLLGGIVLTAGQMAQAVPANDAAAKRIQRYAARMNRLISDLIDVASIDAGKLSIEKVTCDAAALVDEAVELFKVSAAAKDISLDAEVALRPFLVELDHDRLIQVLANLITNSIKFTPSGGRISIFLDQDGNNLHLQVADTGSGIPENMQEAVFQRFWQAGKNDRRGLGLGLYISRCIVEAHGGKIWATSKKDTGSTFDLTLPLTERQSTHGG